MKKYIIFLLLILVIPFCGCAIDFSTYYEVYDGSVDDGIQDDGFTDEEPENDGDDPIVPPSVDPEEPENQEPVVPSPEEPLPEPEEPEIDPTAGLTSSMIADGVLSYPSNNTTHINKHTRLYSQLQSQYYVYSSYYSAKHDVIYIAYDKISNHTQTIDSKDLALIEEHLLNYFESDQGKSEYNDYIRAIRIYPDYESSACRVEGDSSYAQIEGCADYDQRDAYINLNGLVNIDRFFNPLITTHGNTQTYMEPKRDTFAHEYGHVSTYYHMILKNDNSYEDYLTLRLDGYFNSIYPSGLITKYDSDATYNIQPTEILADDYVELYYNVSNKVASDIYDYELDYRNLRHSLKTQSSNIYMLEENPTLFAKVKAYYDTFLNREETVYQTPIVVSASGLIYSNIHDIKNSDSLKNISGKNVIALSEVVVNGVAYYRVILSNVVVGSNDYVKNYDIRDFTGNIGYIRKSNCTTTSKSVLRFTKYNGEDMDMDTFLYFSSISSNIIPVFDFSYFIVEGNAMKLYNVLDEGYGYKSVDANAFK